jgi:hypothetical protein
MWFSSVVLPLPKNPVMTCEATTGVAASAMFLSDCCCGGGYMSPFRHGCSQHTECVGHIQLLLLLPVAAAAATLGPVVAASPKIPDMHQHCCTMQCFDSVLLSQVSGTAREPEGDVDQSSAGKGDCRESAAVAAAAAAPVLAAATAAVATDSECMTGAVTDAHFCSAKRSTGQPAMQPRRVR